MKIKSNFVSFSETLNLPSKLAMFQIQDNANNSNVWRPLELIGVTETSQGTLFWWAGIFPA